MKKLMILAMVLVGVLAFTAPAFAGFSVGMRALTDFGYMGKSEELTRSGDDITQCFIHVPDHSYLRAKFMSDDKKVGGMVELGFGATAADSAVATGATNVYLRYAFGWWKVGNCTLQAGQQDTPFGPLGYHPRQYLGWITDRKLLLLGWGFAYTGRKPGIKFEWAKGGFGFTIQLVQPMAQDEWQGILDGAAEDLGGMDAYAVFPRLDLGVEFSAGGFSAAPSFYIVNYQIEGAPSSYDDSYTSWGVQIPLRFTAGMFTAKAQFYYAINPYRDIALADMRPAWNGDGQFEDTKLHGGNLSLEFKFGKAMAVVGAGYQYMESDSWTREAGYDDDNTTRMVYFLAVPYTVHKNFTIWPEFSYWDSGDSARTGDDQGNTWLLGVEFRFIF